MKRTILLLLLLPTIFAIIMGLSSCDETIEKEDYTVHISVLGDITFEDGTFVHGERGSMEGVDEQYETYLPIYNKIIEACKLVEWDVKYNDTNRYKNLGEASAKAENLFNVKLSALNAIITRLNNYLSYHSYYKVYQFDMYVNIDVKVVYSGQIPEYGLSTISPKKIYIRYEGALK